MPPSHVSACTPVRFAPMCGDKQEGRPREAISGETEKISVKRHLILRKYRCEEVVEQRRALIQRVEVDFSGVRGPTEGRTRRRLIKQTT